MKKTINTLFDTCMMIIKLNRYIQCFQKQAHKWMYFLIESDDLLEKYYTIWDRIRADIEKEFNSEPVYNKSFLKPK